MTSSWPLRPLGEVAHVRMGQSPPGSTYNGERVGTPLVNGPAQFGKHAPKTDKWTTAPTTMSEVGDIVFCVRGSTTGRMVRADGEYCMGRGVAAIACSDHLDTDYLSYALTDRLPTLLTHATGSTFPNLSQKALRTIDIAWPEAADRAAIAEVLGAFDDLIVRSEAVQELALVTAATMWEEARRSAPLVTTVGQVVEFENRRRVPLSSRERERRPGPYPYHGATGVFGHIDDFIFDGPRVLVGEDGSVVNDDGTAVVQYPWGRFWVNNHAHVLTTKLMSIEQLFLAMRRVNVQGFVTGAAQPKLSMGRLKQVPITMPSAEAIAETEPAIGGLMERYRAAEEEARTAASLRDLLLPELLSGRLKVDRPEQLLEGAM